jgi:hypothetical protein
MGAFQNNSSNGWVDFKFTHWRPLALGNNKIYKNTWHINLMNTPYELLPHGMYPKKKEIVNCHQSHDQFIKENSVMLMLQIMRCCNYYSTLLPHGTPCQHH